MADEGGGAHDIGTMQSVSGGRQLQFAYRHWNMHGAKEGDSRPRRAIHLHDDGTHAGTKETALSSRCQQAHEKNTTTYSQTAADCGLPFR